MRMIGLDVGTKNIGVAVSDESCTIATPKGAIKRTSTAAAIAGIMAVLHEYSGGVDTIVVGLPINMNGTLGPRAEDSKQFAAILRERTGLEIVLWDERLSTSEAEKVMIAADVSRGKRKLSIDKLAAQLILQSYLDSRARS